jgi:hypothetical protein
MINMIGVSVDALRQLADSLRRANWVVLAVYSNELTRFVRIVEFDAGVHKALDGNGFVLRGYTTCRGNNIAMRLKAESSARKILRRVQSAQEWIDATCELNRERFGCEPESIKLYGSNQMFHDPRSTQMRMMLRHLSVSGD